jgi:uroporphyrinogen-III decarboxylase
VGDRGVLCFSVGDALGHVVGLFDFEEFVIRCHDDDGPVRALLAKAQALVLRAIHAIGAVVQNAAFRLWGPEYAGAPLMDPSVYFRRYVVEQDRQATAAIHATNNFSVIHCHGRLHDLLDMIGAIGADALEPIETLPLATADVTLADVKRKLGRRMCLMGAVQALTLETGTSEQVRQQVREAIEAAGEGGGFVLLPTAAPFMVPLDARCLANCEAMYRAAHEFGGYLET